MVIAMRVFILPLDGVFDTGLAALLDVFGTANELAELSGITSLKFETTIVGVRRRVHTAQGLAVPVVEMPARTVPDLIILPALGTKMPDALQAALARPDVRDAAEVLRRCAARGSRVAAACIGTFVMAESGLLDGHDATTTWWLAPMFRQRYPRVRLDESRMLVNSGAFVTAGAALSHVDMALSLIRRASPELASLAAKYLIVDSRPSQSPYLIPDHLAHADPLVKAFERWARERLAQGFSLDAAAQTLATSKRTLARRLQAVLGKSPLSYFQDLRVERAVHLLKTSELSVDEIAERVGYSEGLTLRALLRRKLGQGVRQLRMG
jgi:transcriptional regulator GlxA family with amidase domain